MREPVPKTSYQGGHYHIYNRGNRKQEIFVEDADYLFYLEKLRKYKEKYKIGLLCYCLMPNHIHLLVRQDSEIPLNQFIQAFHTSYSMYFNRQYDKGGHLFQGRFKQRGVEQTENLLYLSSYIHLNPVGAGLVEKLEDYQWSSYPDYIGLRQGTLCDKEMVLLDATPEEYRQITEEEVKEKLLMKSFILEDIEAKTKKLKT